MSKGKYLVTYEAYNERTGMCQIETVQTFKSEQAALKFVDDPKNMRMYGELFIERYDADGSKFEFDYRNQEWKETNNG